MKHPVFFKKSRDFLLSILLLNQY